MPQRPFFDFAIDGWKIAVLTVLFALLLLGALTWFDAPWSFL